MMVLDVIKSVGQYSRRFNFIKKWVTGYGEDRSRRRTLSLTSLNHGILHANLFSEPICDLPVNKCYVPVLDSGFWILDK